MKQFPGTGSRRARGAAVPALVIVGALALGHVRTAEARLNGVATSCDACHRTAQAPKVTITMVPLKLDPGATATITVEIAAVNGGVAGFYLHARGFGSFQELPGEGTRLPTASEVVHAAPKAGNGTIKFSARWTAPAKPGSYGFEAWGVSADNNRAISGDGAKAATLSFTIGCEGIPVYADFDGDGYGSDANGPSQACELQPGYVMKAGDCNDYRAAVHKDAPEICDEYDNDCDGQINEGLENATVYRDADGDGHGDRFSSDMRVGCAESGYSTLRDDCNDKDREIFPGAKEICNNKDDNCNNRVDEGARLTCGVGWCRSIADTCVAATCSPGSPRTEQCNLIDDDCDGVIDNEAPCPAGRLCVTGRCLQADDARAVMEAQNADGGAPASDAGGKKPSAPNEGDAGAGTGRSRERPGCQYGSSGHSGLLWLLALVSGLLVARRRAR